MPLNPPCDDAGNPIDDETYSRLCEREYAERELRPRDCVRSVRLNDGRIQLLAFDGEGDVRASLTLPAGKVSGMDELWLLDRVRRIPPHRPLLKVIG